MKKITPIILLLGSLLFSNLLFAEPIIDGAIPANVDQYNGLSCSNLNVFNKVWKLGHQSESSVFRTVGEINCNNEPYLVVEVLKNETTKFVGHVDALTVIFDREVRLVKKADVLFADKNSSLVDTDVCTKLKGFSEPYPENYNDLLSAPGRTSILSISSCAGKNVALVAVYFYNFATESSRASMTYNIFVLNQGLLPSLSNQR
jgi:hypothetical protein